MDPAHPAISALSTAEGIRLRPALYLGPLDDPLLPNRLLQESICVALDDAANGACSRVQIEIAGAGRARVVDDGPGWPIDVANGKRMAEAFMTELFACQHGKKQSTVGRDVCQMSLAVLNAFSAECVLLTRRDGFAWRQAYEKGVPVSLFEALGPTNERGTELSFRLDATVLSQTEFSLEALVDWLRKQTAGLAVLVHDKRTEQVIELGAA